MIGFQVLHRPKPFSSTLTPESSLVFETCLRQIWVCREDIPQSPDWLTGPKAYELILEIISGLHSPVFGETEILCQFKKFLDLAFTQNRDFDFFKPWAKRLLEDVKIIRCEYLQNHGQHGYGSHLRKTLKDHQEIWLLGAGEFAKSLLPWLDKHDVTLWVRSPEKAQAVHPKVAPLKSRPPATAAVIVAAPLTNQELENLISHSWVDLREAGEAPKIQPALLTLSQIFHAQTQEDRCRKNLILEITSRIQKLAKDRSLQSWNRPLGWEDLECAS